MAVAAEAPQYIDAEPRFAEIAHVDPELRKSFDPLASVRMFRYDIQHFGSVLPGTRERVRDEELSYLSEGVDRAARTEFIITRQEDDLTYYKNGRWQSYTAMLVTGVRVAKAEAAKDYRKQFLEDAATEDLAHGYKMRSLKPGEHMVWASPYRSDIEDMYGDEFMRQSGRNPDRQMGFLYRACCTETGDIVLESQTIDRSDDEAISAALNAAQEIPDADMDTMVDTYDEALSDKYGGSFYAGRRNTEVKENAWKSISVQEDLIGFFLNKLETLARQPLFGDELETAVKSHIYGVWAAFKKRLDGDIAHVSYTVPGEVSIVQYALLEQEVNKAYSQFAMEGRIMIGCGGTIKILQGENNIMNASGEEVFSAIFGRDEDRYGSLTFDCPKGHKNRRPRGKLIPNCQHCGISVKC